MFFRILFLPETAYAAFRYSPAHGHPKRKKDYRIHPIIFSFLISYQKRYVSRTISRVMSLNGHLSRPAVAGRLKQPTRKQAGRLMLSVRSCFEWGLHGPLLLPGERWSLTPPFHPYTGMPVRYISVALSLESPPPDVIWHPAL